jgi:hypothetical protein
VINAPKSAVKQGSRSFQNTFTSRIGEEYAISAGLYSLLSPGCTVALLSKDEKLRAEGKLLKLVPKSWTNNGLRRYDVHIKNLKMVAYKPERLNRNGIAVI